MLKLNLASGDSYYPDYTNVDLYSERADVKCDVRNLTFVEDNSVDEILSSHIVEHFAPEELHIVFKEWHRVLRPGGRLVLELPNIERCFRMFGTADRDLRFKLLNNTFGLRGEGMAHLYGWTYEFLKEVLANCGFDGFNKRFAYDTFRTGKPIWAGFRLITHKMPYVEQDTLFSIIMPISGGLEGFRGSFEGLLTHTEQDCEIILVDNGADKEVQDYILDWAGEDDRIIYLRYANRIGYSKAVNIGFNIGKGQNFILVDSDAVITRSDWLGLLYSPVLRGDIVAGMISPQKLVSNLKDFETEFMCTFCCLIPRNTVDKVGRMDENIIGGCEDIDYSYRVKKAGLSLVQVPDEALEYNNGIYIGEFPAYHKGYTTYDYEKRQIQIEKNRQILIEKFGEVNGNK